ncbi:MAG: hypothetical protein PWP65_774 [Clostridia bacterium]|nr:hypothetical protein [Clostridia bacterium]
MRQPKIVIVGGVATGPKAAARARRCCPDAEITVIERGRLISYGSCGLPLFLSGTLGGIDELRRTPSGVLRDEEFFKAVKNVNVLTGTEACRIDRDKKEVEVRELATGRQFKLPYDRLVLATGAEPVKLPVPGNDLPGVYNLHHPEEAIALKAWLEEKKVDQVAIIGAGLIGLEVADALASPRRKVVLIEKEDQVLPSLLDKEMAELLLKRLRQRRVEVRLSAKVQAFQAGGGGELEKVLTAEGEVPARVAVVAAGVRPNVKLAEEAGLEIGRTGAIAVNAYLQTSDPEIYAGGDCVENYHLVSGKQVYAPMASTANKHGRVIGTNITGGKEKFPGVLGTTVLQAFEVNIGRTGLTEREARELGYDVVTAVVPSTDAAHYHPLHGAVVLKVVADARSGKLLGAQAVGSGEVVKRIDVLATALGLGGKIDDMGYLDLGYAPVFATPLDVSLHAVNVLRNKRDGLVKGIAAGELRARMAAGEALTLLDVRSPGEFAARRFDDPRVLHIPLGNLRQRIGEIPRDREIVTICELGVRAYEAAIILQGEGIQKVTILDGGLEAWPFDLAIV